MISLRWFIEAADLPHKLERSRSNLIVGHGRLEIEEDFDVSAHELMISESWPSRKGRMIDRLNNNVAPSTSPALTAIGVQAT